MIRVFASFLLGFIALAANSAHAAENIRFDARVDGAEKLRLDSFFKQSSDTFGIARVDLNEDGSFEYIVRTGCDGECTYAVLAEADGSIIELASIKARTVQLSGAYTDSVRNIIAFQTPGNDYKQTVYVWEPDSARYMIKQD